MIQQSTTPVEYYVQPPSIPDFLYGHSLQAWRNLMVWSYQEYRIRLQKLSRGGYYKELTEQSNNFSPVRILAESHKFRKYCALLAKSGASVWKQMSKDERKFIMAAYEMRELLFRYVQ